VKWTPRGKRAVESKEFRFTSPWIDALPVGSKFRVRRLRNVALTNQPATLGAVPLTLSMADDVEAERLARAMASKSHGPVDLETLEALTRNGLTADDYIAMKVWEQQNNGAGR